MLTPSTITRIICIAFIIGVAYLSWGLIIACVCIVFCITFFKKYFVFINRKVYFLIAVLVLLGFGFGVWRYLQTYPTQESIVNYIGKKIVISGTVVDTSMNESWQHLTLSDLKNENLELEDRVMLTTIAYPKYEYGDRISVECELEAPEQIEDFKYDRYLHSKNIWATCFSYKTWNVAEDQGSALKGVLLKVRGVFLNKMDQVFGEPHASLLSGLLFGEKRFTEVWEDRFLKTGTTHIVAASGYNISVVLWIAMSFFAILGVKRQKAFAFLVASIVGYILLAGADSAVFRAGVMGIVLILAHQSERRTNMFNILLLTAVVMLIINPRLLRDDVGFQLSMMSTTGLIYLSPIVKKKIKWVPKQFLIQESLTATLSATLMSLPIILFAFGSFSFVSMIANVLVLPWIPIAMAGGAISTLIGFINVHVGALLSAPAWLALTIMLWIIHALASLNLFVS